MAAAEITAAAEAVTPIRFVIPFLPPARGPQSLPCGCWAAICHASLAFTRFLRGAGGPERAVAWNDEDAVTMAVSAAVNCLRGFDRASVDALLFAATTYAFKEKQAAALVAKALDLRRDVRTTDVSGSLRAGTDALHAALDAVLAGSAKRVLVVASDARLGAPGSAPEQTFGDGAAAFLVGSADAIASFEGAFSIADEIVDVGRSEGEPFVHSWEERFVVQEGYRPGIWSGHPARRPHSPPAYQSGSVADSRRRHARSGDLAAFDWSHTPAARSR